jgi:hypothetical protein
MNFRIAYLIALIGLLITHPHKLCAQDQKTKWFPRHCTFPLLRYDLLEVQPFAGIFYLHSNKTDKNAAYIPVNLGFRKSFLRLRGGLTTYELVLGAGSYTQFEMMRFDEKTLRGGLLNTDFKASGFLNIEKKQHNIRLQVFHISSHLGDDYILRNQYFELNDKTVNYEQIDLIYLYNLLKTDLYLGIGFVVTPNAFRDRLMMQCGMQSVLSLKQKLDFTCGIDAKVYEENNFKPDLHAGAGLTLKQDSFPQISFLLDLYTGHVPYSTLNLGQVIWIGPSCRIFL